MSDSTLIAFVFESPVHFWIVDGDPDERKKLVEALKLGGDFVFKDIRLSSMQSDVLFAPKTICQEVFVALPSRLRLLSIWKNIKKSSLCADVFVLCSISAA